MSADLLGAVLPGDSANGDATSEVLPIVGLFFTVSLSVYLGALMIRRSWLRHYDRAGRLASDLVRRELLIYYTPMVTRLVAADRRQPQLRRPSSGGDSGLGGGTDTNDPRSISTLALGLRCRQQAVGGGCGAVPPASPSCSVFHQHPLPPPSVTVDGPGSSACLPYSLPRTPPRTPPSNGAIPRSGGTLHLLGINPAYQMCNWVGMFAELEGAELINDSERDGLVSAVSAELRHRIWLLHLDHANLLVRGAFDSAYREYRDILVHSLVQLLPLLR